ncbi:copper-binding transcription factor [Rhodotorula kratochvilovae]
MVLIDGTKYACQSCIKGHRSSKCTHTSRPLTEIKKKGRPTSQCTHCRELRKTKSVHGRCDCAAREAEHAVATPEPDEPALTATEPSGVTRLLNPCNCLRGGKCTCCTVVKRGAPKAFPQDAGASPVASTSSSGGCCSSSAPLTSEALFVEPEPVASALPTPPPLDFTADIPTSGIELPSLWAHRGSPDSSTAAADPLPHFSPATPTSNPLPSLRTLYPALLDLELALPTPPAGPAPPTQALDPAALARELGLAPCTAPAEEEERADCSAVYLQEPLDDACGSGGAADGEDVDQGGCHCSSACGCRAGLEHGEEQEDADEGELGRLAELAALGAFG